MKNEKAQEIYRTFCEEPDAFTPLAVAWAEYENAHGPIEVGSIAEKLIIEAIAYALAGDRVP